MFRQTVNEVRAALKAVGIEDRTPCSEGPTDGAYGLCYLGPKPRIVIKPGLEGCQLWRVLLHEFGHAQGLDHTRVGIMRAKSIPGPDFDPRPPTARQIKRWTAQVARLVLEKRIQTWAA